VIPLLSLELLSELGNLKQINLALTQITVINLVRITRQIEFFNEHCYYDEINFHETVANYYLTN
jgi:hypothetical protein